MTKTRSTKSALISSVVALLLCFAMLVGSTFAWFTDSVTSAGNIIKSGTLDVELYYADGKEAVESADWKNADGVAIYTADQLWEPGYTDAKHLKVSNEGSLALKYQLAIVPTGEVSELADVIDVYYIENGQQITDRTDLDTMTKRGTLAELINTGIATGNLEDGENFVATIVLKMQETADNKYQNLSIGDDFTIQLLATQYTAEEDGFDKYYDAGAPWIGGTDTAWYEADPNATEFTLKTSEELAGLAQLVNAGNDFNGKTIRLESDIDLNNLAWTPIGASSSNKFDGTFIGTGYTIYNLNVSGTKGVGLFGYVWTASHIEGVTIDGATVSGNDYVGAVVGTGYMAPNCLLNCTVENATIIATPYLKADGVTYDGGAKAGAVAGFLSNANIKGNKAIDCSITAYRDLGGIIGMAQAEDRSVEVSGNSVENVTVNYVGVGGSYDSNTPNENMGTIIGRTGTLKGNTVTVQADNEKLEGKAPEYVIVTTVSELQNALANGESVTLTDDVTAPLANSAIYGTPVAVIMQPGAVFDGNGNSLYIEKPQYNAYAMETYGGTIKNLTIDSTVGRGIMISSPKEDVLVDNVIVDGPGYALNTTEHNGKNLIVTDSTLKGWISFAGLDSASFKNCTFGENTSKYWQGMGYDQDYDRLMRPYVDTTLTECTFEKGFYLSLDVLGTNGEDPSSEQYKVLDADATVTLTNCVCDGVEITAENYANYITVERGPVGHLVINGVTVY